jgi:hypothetical protein
MSLSYERSGDVIEITIRDGTRRRVGTWKFNAADKELGESIMKHIRNKYGFAPEIDKVPEKKKDVNFWDMESNW